MKKMAKRIAALTLTAMLMMSCAALFAGCAQENSEEVIREGISQELDVFKNLDEATVEELVSQSGASYLEDFGIDPSEFIKSYLAGFDYRIENVTVDGDAATATVVLSSKDYAEYSNGIKEITETLTSGEGLEGITSLEEAYQVYGNEIMTMIDSLPVVESDPIELTFEKTDNMWAAAAGTDQAIASALFGGM